MFGLRKKTEQPEGQIPYEVYETVQQPAAQRRRWIIRLVAALLAVTLLIFGSLALSRAILNRGDGNGSGGQQTQSGGQSGRSGNNLKPPDSLRQDPKKDNTPPASNAKPDVVVQGGDTVKSTVRKPE